MWMERRYHTPMLRTAPPTPHNWFSQTEGQLSIDLHRDQGSLVLRAPMAGVAPENLDIAMDGDLLTIRGKREMAREVNEDDWFYRECYWGAFSRSLVLPLDVDASKIEAKLKEGVLEIRLPLIGSSRRVPISLDG